MTVALTRRFLNSLILVSVKFCQYYAEIFVSFLCKFALYFLYDLTINIINK